jgi:hypothetical protein
MSGIAKPMVNCSTSTTPNKNIPVEKIVDMQPLDIVDPNDATRNRVQIVFSMDSTSPQRTIKLLYPGSLSAARVLRDASLAAIKALIGTTTV